MVYTIIGGLVGFTVGILLVPKDHSTHGGVIQCFGIIACGVVGASVGFGIGVTSLANGNHIIQKM